MKGIAAGLVALTVLFSVGHAFADDAPIASPPPDQTTQPAPPAQPTPVATQTTTKDPRDEVVCRKETLTGSRLGGKRVCLTRREWDQITRDSQEALRRNQDKAGTKNPVLPGGAN